MVSCKIEKTQTVIYQVSLYHKVYEIMKHCTLIHKIHKASVDKLTELQAHKGIITFVYFVCKLQKKKRKTHAERVN